MCPDDQILSAYYDGEVPVPWDGRIEEHLKNCQKCSHRLENFNRISEGLKSPESILTREMELSLDRVYERIKNSSAEYHPHIWQRQVRVPVAFLAAAAAIAVFFGLGFITGTGMGKDSTMAEVPVVDDASGVMTVQLEDGDMVDLAELLKNRDEQVQVFIELPPASFIDSGDEPQLIRAADYRP